MNNSKVLGASAKPFNEEAHSLKLPLFARNFVPQTELRSRARFKRNADSNGSGTGILKIYFTCKIPIPLYNRADI